LTPSAAFNFCQEAAGGHAQELGLGISNMEDNGIAWILSRMSLVLDRRPARTETVRVRTWPRGSERLFVHRDYELTDSSGAVFARGRSAWLIVDLVSKRPRRPESFIEGFPRNEGLDALIDGAQGLDSRSDLRSVSFRTAAYSDLDYNGHVNNARYVQWIQDSLDPNRLAAAEAFRLDVNYISETKAGSSVEIFADDPKPTSDGGSLYRIEGRKEQDSAVVFRAALRLR